MKLLRHLSCMMLFFTIISCGGSGGSLSRDDIPDDGTGGTGNDTESITLTLAISDSYVTNAEPAVITATLLDGTTPLVGQVVTFSSSIAQLSPASGTALTNESGVATISLTAGDVRGAGSITAQYGDNVTATALGFETQGDEIHVGGDVNVTLQLVDGNGAVTDTISSSNPGQLIATVNGINSPVLVVFSSEKGVLPIDTAITDQNSQASVAILAGSDLGAVEVTATLSSGEVGSTLISIGASNLSMGSGEPFVEGVADITLSEISAGGTSSISVAIVDENGNPYQESIEVNFTSSCASSDPIKAVINSPITTTNGLATSTYLAQGCENDDLITVTATAGGSSLSASAQINVLSADVGSIEFVSTDSELLAIKGLASAERPESAEVIFKVLDETKQPVGNKLVTFSLNSENSEFSLTQLEATTDSNGLVRTFVKSGTVAGSVGIKASITDPDLSSESVPIKASTGIPDQDSFSISADIRNPEAWDIDGQEVVITARLADASNNPPPPTVVYFTTEGGSIENNDSTCTTDSSGTCSVIWRSQSPRPEGHVLGDVNNPFHVPEVDNSMGQKFGGRVTILATTVGEESFADLNGNGRFDLCESTAFIGGTSKGCAADGSFDNSSADITFSGNDVAGRPFDLKEAFIDYNEDGFFNPSETGGELGGELEEPSDFNNNGIFDGQDGQYNGVLCSLSVSVPNTFCSDEKSVDISSQLVLVMSGSHPELVTTHTYDGVSDDIDNGDPLIPNPPNPNFDADDDTIYIAGENSGSAIVIISDRHNQPMPAGTTVTFSTSAGSISSGATTTWESTNNNGGKQFIVGVKGASEPDSGELTVRIETPSGVAVTIPVARVTIL